MVRMFNDIMKGVDTGGEQYISTESCSDPTKMMSTILRSVTDSMTSSVSSSASTIKAVERTDIIIDKSTPNFDLIRMEKCNKFTMNKFLSIEELMSADEDRPAVLAVPVVTDMKVAPRPFDRGSVRAAHKAREYNADGITFRDLIHKINLSQKREHLTRQAYEENAIANQVAAICFAEEFERVKPSGAATIEFAEVFLLQYLEKTGVPYCAVETELKGVWLKYNNNSGMVRRSTYDSGDQEHDIIQCFSHWTFERSGGRMLVSIFIFFTEFHYLTILVSSFSKYTLLYRTITRLSTVRELSMRLPTLTYSPIQPFTVETTQDLVAQISVTRVLKSSSRPTSVTSTVDR